ncbi:hypothetical protein [Mycobacterium talmoniae]|uniref:Proline rich protein n=1 Tax=Mycobacterium talmoniae TaxID=1858794 RepID=A0A1S1NFH2_9MYCO|nr:MULTISPECIES: hypothetical protein [Mycobacterium]OHV04418.1 hypothetical protein BKN37_10215 [Mycobacterium talmoniae]TDH54163.1 hypothetical protein E2F47_11600 [Mycobacterium eburneum]
MKVTLPKLKKNADGERGWPAYLFGGHVRTSTVVLIVAFFLVWWVYDAYQPPPKPVPAPQVVPPGFVPDPNYTWVPRSRLQQPPATVTETVRPPTVTETVTPTTTAPPTTSSEPPPPPFCPPFCPPSPSEPAPPGESPSPAPGQSPTPAPPTVTTTPPPR